MVQLAICDSLRVEFIRRKHSEPKMEIGYGYGM